MRLSAPTKIPVDAHVHFHGPHRVEATLDAATGNFRRLGITDAASVRGVLLLAQAAQEAVFEWLRDQPQVGAWAVARVPAEPQSLWLRRPGAEILVVCGRQVEVEPGLELLVLGTERRVAPGAGLARAVQEAEAEGSLAVLPWGFGKWAGRRKRRVREAIAARDLAGMWMGDNGGRLAALPRPPLLAAGERAGRPVLPGSDPFPFGADYRRVGSFGCLVEVALDAERPWRSLRAALIRDGASPDAYGIGTGLIEFGLKQVGMQVRKRLGGWAS